MRRGRWEESLINPQSPLPPSFHNPFFSKKIQRIINFHGAPIGPRRRKWELGALLALYLPDLLAVLERFRRPP
jgi:hypothetical protein